MGDEIADALMAMADELDVDAQHRIDALHRAAEIVRAINAPAGHVVAPADEVHTVAASLLALVDVPATQVNPMARHLVALTADARR